MTALNTIADSNLATEEIILGNQDYLSDLYIDTTVKSNMVIFESDMSPEQGNKLMKLILDRQVVAPYKSHDGVAYDKLPDNMVIVVVSQVTRVNTPEDISRFMQQFVSIAPVLEVENLV